jgi:hypothetical protein
MIESNEMILKLNEYNRILNYQNLSYTTIEYKK